MARHERDIRNVREWREYVLRHMAATEQNIRAVFKLVNLASAEATLTELDLVSIRAFGEEIVEQINIFASLHPDDDARSQMMGNRITLPETERDL